MKMNQWIKIDYKPYWKTDPNSWCIWFLLNGKAHREKAPSRLDSTGYWKWRIYDIYQKHGFDFDWDNK